MLLGGPIIFYAKQAKRFGLQLTHFAKKMPWQHGKNSLYIGI
jgi:hypothetical protein